MFYGLPSTYLDTFYGVQQPPVLMTQIQKPGYQLALFAAPGFTAPTDIERTVFAGIPGCRASAGTSAPWIAIAPSPTSGWRGSPAATPTQPFFGFLYYDPPMSEMSADPAEPLPMDDRFTANDHARQGSGAGTGRAAQFADGELARVLASLRETGAARRYSHYRAQRSRL